MPDPTKQTVSASQAAALFDESPYLTRWLLWQIFARGANIEPEPNDRMDWGKRLEPAILAATAEELSLDVQPNAAAAYHRRDGCPIGCTLDATIRDLNRGPGIVEAKSVDWLIWKDQWTKTEAPPHIEIQVQAQLLATGHQWGLIACLVGGNELRLYPREPEPERLELLEREANAFLASVQANEEPAPLGVPSELRLWRDGRQFDQPVPPVELMESKEASELLAELAYWKGMESQAKKLVAIRKAKLETLVGDADQLRAWGWTAYLKRSKMAESAVELPPATLGRLREAMGFEGLPPPVVEALQAAYEFRHVTRQAVWRVMIDVKEHRQEGDPPWLDEIPDWLAAG